MIDPVLYWTTSLCLAVLWASAALGKWRGQDEFRQVLSAYRLLPPVAVPLVARILPLCECLLALGLMIPFTQSVAAVSSAVLLLAYASAMAVNLARGRIHIDCGCSLGAKQGISWWLVLRNSVFAFLAMSLLLPTTVREWHLADLLITLLVVVFLCLAYPLVQLITSNMRSLTRGVEQ